MNIINEESIFALLENKDKDELIVIIKNMLVYQMRMQTNLESKISNLVKIYIKDCFGSMEEEE